MYNEDSSAEVVQTGYAQVVTQKISILEKTDLEIKYAEIELNRLHELKSLLQKNPEVQRIIELMGSKLNKY